MQESLLQFIWQYSLYSPAGLRTTDGEPVTVIHPGRRNTDAGPDFTEARIRIGNALFVGQVELHVQSSDWKRHGHQENAAYRNIILHVVYKDDSAGIAGNTPVLQLGPAIPGYVLQQYGSLIDTLQPIACARQLDRVKGLVKESWLGRMLAERWEQKLEEWAGQLKQSAGDWRSLLYWRMAANFGFKVNTQPFLQLAQSLPLSILGRHRENLLQTEALLFGQAGMLNGRFRDEYPQQLQAEYKFLAGKYRLRPLPAHLWKFMRLRPANFPTIRIAQFAMLLHRSMHLLARLLEAAGIPEIESLLDVSAGDYWQQHVRFDERQEKAVPRKLGTDSVHNIIINTVAPLRFLYAHQQGRTAEQEQALQLLEALPAEDNAVIRRWEEQGWKAGHAAASQALLQLYNHYCNNKRCLECSIGLSIIRSGP